MDDLISNDPIVKWRQMSAGKRAALSLYCAANSFYLRGQVAPSNYVLLAEEFYSGKQSPFSRHHAYDIDALDKIALTAVVERIAVLWKALSYVDRGKLAAKYARIFMA